MLFDMPAKTVRSAIHQISGPAQDVRRKAADSAAMPEAPSLVNEVLRSPGLPLEPKVQNLMQARLGSDFSRVRVHTDSAAAESARSLSAAAYTAGRDIVFGDGLYQPHTVMGRRLLVHELAHVVQQGGAPVGDKLRIGAVGDVHEAAADRAAATIDVPVQSTPCPVPVGPLLSAPLIQRQLIPAPNSPVPLVGPYSGYQPFPASPSPPKQQPSSLVKELEALINGANWKEIRKRVYPKESAVGVQRAKDRKAGKLADLTGLGRIKTLEHFVSAVRGIQAQWAKLAVPDRKQKLGDAGSAELKNAGVPGFLDVNLDKTPFKGFFNPRGWEFLISEELVNTPLLNNADAAEVANTTLHESRHAEQAFLAARFSAGVRKNDAATVAAEQGIPTKIASEAVAKKIDAKSDRNVAALGARMYQARVTEGAQNRAISGDDGLSELEDRSKEAQTALNNLKAAVTPQTTADATAKRDALRAQIGVVEQRYTLYRNIPYEADAHEVGDAAEQAFRGWP